MVNLADTLLKWCPVSLGDVLARDRRLEASVFDVAAKQLRTAILNGPYPCRPLLGPDGLVEQAHYPDRFKRIYCDERRGIPFFLPSQMADIYPRAEKFISPLTHCNMDELRLRQGTLLLSRSGTIGALSLVTDTLAGKVFSDDVIRISFRRPEDLGYVYTYLKSRAGGTVLQTNGYGSVITHLEPEHLTQVPVPDAPLPLRSKIHELVTRSYALRDQSNVYIDMATDLLTQALDLPPWTSFTAALDEAQEAASVRTFSVPCSRLAGRGDASYHLPLVDAICRHLQTHAAEVTLLGDPRLSRGVVLPGRFKRVFVSSDYGVRFIGGKEISQLDPLCEKYLSCRAHRRQLEGALGIKPFSILTPARGSLGKVALASPQFYNWAISDNMMQILSYESCCGYLYIFLNTDYGRALIRRFTYGGVVDAIEPLHLRQVPVPLLKQRGIQQQINDLALLANETRYEAYRLERQALQCLQDEVLQLL